MSRFTVRRALARLARLALLALAAAACRPADFDAAAPAPAESLRAPYQAGLDSLLVAVERLDSAVVRLTPDPATHADAQRAFVAARTAFKRVEPLVEQFSAAAAASLNGPALPEIEEADPNLIVREPDGFQVIEEMLFPVPVWEEREELHQVVLRSRGFINRARQMAVTVPFTDANVWDAMRLEIARVLSLGLSGFDSPVALHSMRESAVALESVRALLAPYRPALEARDPEAWRAADARLAAAAAALAASPSFDAFDRLAFVVEHANPALEALHQARAALAVPPAVRLVAWRNDAATPFDAGAFDPLHFARPGAVAAAPAAESLGRALFADVRLSGDGSRACISCHEPQHAFAEARPRSAALGGRAGVALRNAPTVINVGLQSGSFYDLRTTYLEDQIADVVANRDEMHGSLTTAAASLARDSTYLRWFAAAYGDRAITAERIQGALAAYLRALDGMDSRFDRYVRGDRAQLTAEERRGFNVFMGKGKCGTCHFMPLFNGTVPPRYDKTDVEVIGVPERPVWTNATVDPDVGRFAVEGNPLHRHAFKTPTVRNVALTAPYMHNGVYATLEEVVDFYDAGGGAGIGIDLPNQTLPPDSLRLTSGEKRALVAFLKALTDTSGVR